jgi:hypothetical protein
MFLSGVKPTRLEQYQIAAHGGFLRGPAATLSAPGRRVIGLRYSLFSPAVLPVFGLTKCTDPHARHVTPTNTSSLALSDSSSSEAKPCTWKPVLGHRKMNGGIQPSWLGNPRWLLLRLIKQGSEKSPRQPTR